MFTRMQVLVLPESCDNCVWEFTKAFFSLFLLIAKELLLLFFCRPLGVPFAVASSCQLHFQCLEVSSYVLNACVHVVFQVPTTFALVHCWWELHQFVILHRNERALEFFFTFANATIAREYCIQVLFQGFVCFLCFTVFQIFKDLVNLLCVKHCWGFCVILHYHKSIHENMFDLLRIFFKGT